MKNAETNARASSRYSLSILSYKYFIHRLKAYSYKGFGIHSPFVFKLLREVFKDSSPDKALKEVQCWHWSLRGRRDLIETGNYGAGPVSGRGGRRKVRDIVSGTGISPRVGKFLFHLVGYSRCASILELGTGLGISTAYLRNAPSTAEITSVEGSEDKVQFAEEEFNSRSWKPVKFVSMDFDKFLETFHVPKHPFMAFIDGNHLYAPTIRYFQRLSGLCREDSLLVFDDIHWSEEMEQAWNEICLDENVSISIDLFSMGLVFFRKGMHKQHYRINF